MSCALYRIITLNQAITASDIRIINNKNDFTEECSWSWSTDKICWTPWTSYKNYLKITPNLESDFYLRIRFTGNFTDLLINNCKSTDYTSTLDQTNIFLQEFCQAPNLFQPYQGLDCALLLQKQLADTVICIFGIPIYYVQVDPNMDTKDFTFKEYVLHGVKSIKQIKLMLQDGQLPSSNPQLTELDFTWETDWEVELSKTQFGQAFGDTAFPKYRDLIWVPMMKRLWMVNSAYDEKSEGLLYRSTTWKLRLVKYTEDTAINQNGFEDIIDSWTKNKYEEIFHTPEIIEQERTVGATPLQSPSHAATNTYNMFMSDAVRASMTIDDISILQKEYHQKSNIVARNLYKFNNENAEIIYQNNICSCDGTMIFTLETGAGTKDVQRKTIISAGEIKVDISYSESKNKYNIYFGDLEAEIDSFNVYMVILLWNKNNRITNMIIFKYKHPDNIPSYKLRPEQWYFDFENPITDITGLYNEDYWMRSKNNVIMTGWPVFITNFKLYNTTLSYNDAITESIKYLTTSEYCVINDQARPYELGHGYSIR